MYFLYNHFNITYVEYGWRTYQYDFDIQAIKDGLHEHKTEIDKIGPNIILGYQNNLLDRIIIDFYAGAGLRYSFIETSEFTPKSFNNNIISFGYTGTVPVAGLRVGLMF